MDQDKYIEAYLKDARNVSAGIDPYVPKGWSGWALISVIGTIVGLFGIVGLVKGAIVPFFGLKITEVGGYTISVEHAAFIISLLLSMVGFVIVLTFLIWKLSDSDGRLRSLHAKYLSLMTESSPIFLELRSHAYVLGNISRVAQLTKEAVDSESDMSGTDIEDLIASILRDIKEAFDRITEYDCSVCLKLADIDDGHLEIRTLMRDQKSSFSRVYVDSLPGTRSYDAYANTAFREIIEVRGGKRYFLCNDLKGLAAEGKYQNANPNWAEHYNACLVVPLASEEDMLTEMLGFLCVDNKDGNFDARVGLPILNTYSSFLQILFLIGKIRQDMVQQKNEVKDETTVPSEEKKAGRTKR